MFSRLLRCTVGFCCGSKRDEKPCPLSRQLSPKAAMAAGGTANDPWQPARQRRAVARRVLLAAPPPFQTLSQIGNVIKELPAGPAVVPPINGSVCAVGGRAFR